MPIEYVNTGTTPLQPGYTHIECMVPVPAVVSQAVDLAADGAIINAFAGIPAGTLGEFDLQGILERRIFMFGTSGSDVSDMRTVLRKIEEGIIDTHISLDAVTGMAGFRDAIGHYRKAIDLDPRYASAYAALSQTWARMATGLALRLTMTMALSSASSPLPSSSSCPPNDKVMPDQSCSPAGKSLVRPRVSTQ